MSENTMKISVIIPVYNAEKYIKKCVWSVMNQTYKNWELILVDDGSKDKSPLFIDRFAEMDSRILAIHQKNAGPGEARNRGIEEATGDFVVFLDSDDFIDENYFSLLVPKAENSDVVFIDVLQVTSEGKILSKELMSSYKHWDKEHILRSQMTGRIPWGGVRKTVRRSILVENKIKYTNHKIGEEALYSFKVVYSAKRIDFLDEKPVYYYVNHEGSQSKCVMEDPWGGVVDTLRSYLMESKLYDKYANTVNSFNLTATVIAIDNMSKMYRGKKLHHRCRQRVAYCKKTMDLKHHIDQKNVMKKALVFFPAVMTNFYFPIIFCSRIRNN